jgi:hypothetical protein
VENRKRSGENGGSQKMAQLAASASMANDEK